MSRPIVVAAHGTRSESGQRTITRAAELLAAATGAPVTVGWIDVLEPTVDEVVAGLHSPVVVPWLVGGGFHLLVDVKRAAAANPGATVLAPVGDSPGLVDALVERLGDHASDATTPVALLWAGSRMPVAQQRVAEIARRLGERVGRPVTPVALAASAVPADEAVEALREGSDEPAAVSLLLAPGYFHDLAREVAAVTDPIGTHPALIAAVARDYAQLDA